MTSLNEPVGSYAAQSVRPVSSESPKMTCPPLMVLAQQLTHSHFHIAILTYYQLSEAVLVVGY